MEFAGSWLQPSPSSDQASQKRKGQALRPSKGPILLVPAELTDGVCHQRLVLEPEPEPEAPPAEPAAPLLGAGAPLPAAVGPESAVPPPHPTRPKVVNKAIERIVFWENIVILGGQGRLKGCLGRNDPVSDPIQPGAKG